MRKVTLVLSLLSLSACTMIPDYVRPDFASAPTWNDIPGYGLPEEQQQKISMMRWQDYFSDPALQRAIGIALDNNKDLRLAALNIEEARALYRIERADLVPGLEANGAGNYQKSSDESSPTGKGEHSEIYSANLGVSSYELDLFGRLRSENESAFNEYLVTQAARKTVENTLIAETANAYLQLLADQKLLALTEKTLTAQEHTHDILSQSLEKGLGTAQDVSRAETAVETARVNLHQYRRFVEQDKNALILLMGIAHDEETIPSSTLDDITLPENLPVGMPSEVLLARPDVRQAEYNLLARNADIGAARAAFFPSISLTGSYGFASEGLSGLFTNGAFGAWSFIPQITLPIFQGGRNKAALDLAEVRKEKAIVEYEDVVQTAFREVADELAARATLTEQLKAQRKLVAAAERVYNVSDARFKSGIDSFLSVLDAQRELYIFQQNEIQIERQRLANLVILYKVLGGESEM